MSDWTRDGHKVWYEGPEGGSFINLIHPEECMKERHACPHRRDGKDERREDPEAPWSPFTGYEHEDDTCPDPQVWIVPDCALAYEHDAVGIQEGHETHACGSAADLQESIGLPEREEDAVEIEWWHESHSSPSGPWGPEEYWTEWAWRARLGTVSPPSTGRGNDGPENYSHPRSRPAP